MQKNRIYVTLSFFILIVFTISSGAQWIKTGWPAGNDFSNIYISQNSVFVRTWDALNGGRLFSSADSGVNWTLIGSADSSVDNLSVVMLKTDLLAGTCKGFSRSTTGGTSWSAVTSGGIPDTAIWSVMMVASTLYAGTRGGIYKSPDSGTTWIGVNSGIPANARITSFVARGNTVFAGSDSNGVFMESDGGTGWTAGSSGLTDKHISQLVAMGGRLFAVTLKGVFVSVNIGSGWTSLGAGLRNINCLVVVNKQLLAGTDTGGSCVYLSSDSGATWAPFGEGIPADTRVWSLAAGGDNLFAGTSAGVWRSPLPPAAVTVSGTMRLIRENQQLRWRSGPQPAIQFPLSSPRRADLSVYDLSGHEIFSFVHRQFGAGMQSVPITRGSIAPGAYLVRLKSGSAVYQQVVLLQR